MMCFKKFYLKFNRFSSSEKLMILRSFLEFYVSFDFDGYVLDNNCVKFVKNRLSDFASLTTNLLSLRDALGDDLDAISMLNEYARNNKKRLIDSIFADATLELCDDSLELIKYIVLDIINNEKAMLSDIRWVEGGSLSHVLVIRNKVVKISSDRGTLNFPNNPYIIKPLLRKSFHIKDDEFIIEVVEKVDTSNISFVDAYSVYRKLRDLNLVCLDVTPGNVGRLINDNVIHWNGYLNPSDEILELDSYCGREELKKGDLVLLDGDYIYPYNEDIIKNLSFEMSIFEKLYRIEKKKGLHI